jgi:hypothetical protein
MSGPHPSHVTRISDASSFDEICVNCGATDRLGSWGDLAKPCPSAPPAPDGLEPVAWRYQVPSVNDRWTLSHRRPGEQAFDPGDVIIEPLYSATALSAQEAEIERLRKERDAFKQMCRENYDAFSAMRNDINEAIGDMASQEAMLARGPEMTHECAAVTEAVHCWSTTLRAENKALRAQVASIRDETLEEAAKVAEAECLGDKSRLAGTELWVGNNVACKQVAAAIRDLQTKEQSNG